VRARAGWRVGVSLAAIVLASPPRAAGDDAERAIRIGALGAALDWALLERTADDDAARAALRYRESSDHWTRVATLARDLGDETAIARTEARRAELAVALLDASRYVQLRPGATGAATAPPLAVTAPDAIDAQALESLVRLLAGARAAYSRLEERERRDVPLIYEALAILERVLADSAQARADSKYRAALAALDGLDGLDGLGDLGDLSAVEHLT